jgi:alkaline phosphatase
VSPQGRVLVRYTPKSKPLTHASYPVKAILPDVFAQRRANHGFESLALSPDGRWAYAILQSPMGDDHDERFRQSRVVRALKLDLREPLGARVAGEYLLLASPARDYSAKQKQAKLSFSDAEWIGPDRLLVIEHGKGLVKILAADFTRATDILNHPQSETLAFEDVATDLARVGVQSAEIKELFSTRNLSGITSDKIEGLAVIGLDQLALANDNDFGLGDASGQPSMVWLLRVPMLPSFTK